MYRVTLPRIGTASAWRDAARAAATNGIAPSDIEWAWGEEGQSLFDTAPLPAPSGTLTIPKEALKLLTSVCWHADPERFALAYAGLLRLKAEPRLIHDKGDAGMARLIRMQKNVARCIHKLHAFVRFRELPSEGRPKFAAWFEPTHHTVEPGTPFFAKRFGDMDWVIATPDVTARFEDGRLTYHPGAPRPDLPEDATEGLWTEYYRSIFNPARVKIGAMRSEMPVKYWKNMPETRIIPELLAGAERRVMEMRAAAPSLPPAYAQRVLARQTPQEPDAESLDDLWARASRIADEPGLGRMIPGTGPSDAPLVIMGERPGDMEDRAGAPFVGPAGQMLDRAAEAAGLDRRAAYVTNAVKRFRYEMRGKRRIHQNPNRAEIDHARWWVAQELRLVKPRLLLAMGGTAAEMLTGSRAGLLKRRGQWEETEHGPTFITVHPAYILRLPSADQQAEEEARLVEELTRVAERLAA